MRLIEAFARSLDPADLNCPLELVKAVEENDLALLVDDHEDDEVLRLRQVETAEGACLAFRLISGSRRGFPDEPPATLAKRRAQLVRNAQNRRSAWKWQQLPRSPRLRAQTAPQSER